MAPNERTALLKGNSSNGAHIIDITLDKTEYQEILNDCDISSSLSLEDLLQYKDDPWWQNFRRTVLIAFWFTLCLVFLIACGLMYLSRATCQLSRASILTDTTMESTIATLTTLAS